MKPNILIVGGNGFVGRIIHDLLEKRYSKLNVFIGSRNTKTNGKGQININVTNPNTFNTIAENNISLLVLCTNDKENNILKYCLSNKVDYLDITKPTNELEIACQFVNRKKIFSRVVFSSGWMSGIISSLLNWAEPDLKNIKEVLIFIYYSLNDASGKTSADFMADNVSKPFKVFHNNKTYLAKYYLKPQLHTYLFGVGKRKTYLFDTPDAFILNKSENIPTIKTRTTYSSKYITWLLHIFQITGIYRMLSLSLKKKMFTSNGKGDKTTFEIVFKNKNTSQQVSLQNMTGQAELTAFATVLHIEQLLNSELKDGVVNGK
jgi:saccharopine dehydrogenase-like NADP-dependent oxidoreductase